MLAGPVYVDKEGSACLSALSMVLVLDLSHVQCTGGTVGVLHHELDHVVL